MGSAALVGLESGFASTLRAGFFAAALRLGVEAVFQAFGLLVVFVVIVISLGTGARCTILRAGAIDTRS